MLTGWKTLIFSAALAVVGVLQQADWATIVPPKYTGLALALAGAIAAGLRYFTTTPVGTK